MINCFVNTIVFVKDIEKSKLFYTKLLQMKIKQDFDTIVFFENQLVLHSAESILKTIFKKRHANASLSQGGKNILLYFETSELDKLYKDLENKVNIIHGIEKQEWGQKVFRFFDPDNHMIEFGEPFRVDRLSKK